MQEYEKDLWIAVYILIMLCWFCYLSNLIIGVLQLRQL